MTTENRLLVLMKDRSTSEHCTLTHESVHLCLRQYCTFFTTVAIEEGRSPQFVLLQSFLGYLHFNIYFYNKFAGTLIRIAFDF